MNKKILGVRRAAMFSPNNTGNDSAVFSLTVKELENKGYYVRQVTEEEFFHLHNIEEETIFTMVRNQQNVHKLQQLENNGKTVINSGYGLERCYRANFTIDLIENNIPFPKSKIVSTTTTDYSVFNEFGDEGIWLKRGDFHTIHKEDISFCPNGQYAVNILKEYALRGIPSVVVSEHLHGDLVKFYAVQDTPFFYWFYPLEKNHVKFFDAAHEETRHYKFDEQELINLAKKSADILNIKIYGGDAIISSKGEIKLIDVNDWPSFSPCRDEAAGFIADCIVKNMKS